MAPGSKEQRLEMKKPKSKPKAESGNEPKRLGMKNTKRKRKAKPGNETKKPAMERSKKKSKAKTEKAAKTTYIDKIQKEIDSLKSQYESMKVESILSFDDLPLSKPTRDGLAASDFVRPTDIQRQAIPLALRECDIVGAAKTGSGKTLAFLIPMLELLFRCRWSRVDGLGALIITPTRELAYQIYAVLNQVGQAHDFSAGLIIGGKDLKFERKRMDQVNIIICTPGRLLQHMDENELFNADNLQILVLDEADKCLDMGFARAMDAILEHLPKERQTLLFSATQTKSVADLVRVSLQRPIYVSADELSAIRTPEQLAHSYIVCPAADKIDTLWSFVKHHRHHKILIFVHTCKQVKYLYECFSRLRPGITVLALYGTLHQLRRMAVYDQFCRKQRVIMFATDIAARGLDFPAVHWVVQMDCPENVNTYIHRAGRTARNEKEGECLLFVTPTEEPAMIDNLRKNRIEIEKIEVNSAKTSTAQRKLEAMLARDVALKETAKRALKSYCKSLLLMPDKKVFDIGSLDVEALARSMGLAVAPRIRFIQRQKQRNEQQIESEEQKQEKKEEDGSITTITVLPTTNRPPKPLFRTAYNFHDSGAPYTDNPCNSDDDVTADTGGLLRPKRPLSDADENSSDEDTATDAGDCLWPEAVSRPGQVVSRAAMAKRALKRIVLANNRITFDTSGQAQLDVRKHQTTELALQYQTEVRDNGGGIDIERAKQVMAQEDSIDKQLQRQMIRDKHRAKKIKLKQQRRKQQQEEEQEEEQQEDDEKEDGSNVSERALQDDNCDAFGNNSDVDNADPAHESNGSMSADDEEESESDESLSDHSEPPSPVRSSPSPPRQNARRQLGVTAAHSRSVADDEKLALSLLTS